jgi:hypothetical protein
MMKQWIVILLLLSASTSIAACAELKAGNANFDLGDGYKASFVLPDIGKPYNVEIYPVSTIDILKLKTYGFSISSEGEELAKASMNVYSSLQLNPVPKARTEAAFMPEILGQRVVIPKTIAGAPGYVGYDLQKDASGTDISNAAGGFFRYFPGARKVSDTLGESLESIYEVYGETGGLPSSAQSLQVFNSMVDSIKISGPGI